MTSTAPPPKCPRCGAPSIPILYGEPDEDGFEATERGTGSLGGCTIDVDAKGRANNPAWKCTKCGHEYGRVRGFDRKTK